ncbi:MAG TPA: hypothetical protein DD426_01805, partial [Clostridiaceae bacterium]|nr:hypothetical protein [Clostridiaceae bacterium]
CNYSDVEGKKLNRRPLNFILELFDRENKKGFKDQLVGPSSEAIKIAREVRHVFGHRNFGLMYDLSHMLLIKDNDGKSETPGVLKALAPYLFHIHIGNCVIDKNDPYYGDSHVSMDYRNGAVSKNILKEFVKALVEIGYKGIIGFEVATVKGEVSESVINIHKAYFDDARNSVIVNYALGSYAYVNRKFMPEQLFDMITDIRVAKPYAIYDEAKARRKRENLTLDGKLLILACDHPARCVTSVGDDPIKMGSRFEYLGRILRVLCHEEVDGVMTTPDIMDELFIISGIFREKTGKSFLDDKVLVGCMNRSGLAGFRYEMDDRMTAYDAETIVNMRMDAAKILLRLDKYRHSKESIMTMDYCAKAIDDCNKYDIPVMIEPLPVEHTEDGYKTKMDKDSLIQTIGVASALGNSSRNHWIKIPYVEGYSDVVKSTTMPILMLGGASEGSPVNTLENFERGMGAGRNVRGVLVG